MQPARQDTHTQTDITARKTDKVLSLINLEAHYVPRSSPAQQRGLMSACSNGLTRTIPDFPLPAERATETG